MDRAAEMVRAVGSFPLQHHDRLLRIGRKLQRSGVVDGCRCGELAGGKDRRSEIIKAAKKLRQVGMISGWELFLIMCRISMLYRFIERILFGDES